MTLSIHKSIFRCYKFLEAFKINPINSIWRKTFSISCKLNDDAKISESLHNKHFDIIIAGGGMVGFATAAALGLSLKLEGKRILLLEKQIKKEWNLPNNFSNRVSAINSATKSLFEKIGIWNHIKSLRAHPVRRMQIWESNSEALITFDEQDLQQPVAHIIENDVILNSLQKHIPENIEVVYGAKIKCYNLPVSTDSLVEVVFEDGHSMTADLLIGADGANSGVRKAMECEYVSWEYNQNAIVATLQLFEEQDNHIAWQKFLPTGPIAMLPLSSTYSSLVWSTSKEESKRLLALNDFDFIDALNNSIWNDEPTSPLVRDVHENWLTLLQTFVPSSNAAPGVKMLPPSFSSIVPKSRACFPLGLGHSCHYVAPRIALVGDAAHRVHPLAGQGVNLGFGDVEQLVSVLENAVNLGCDIGDEKELHEYETKRQRHNVLSMAAIDGLHRLYSTSFIPLVLLRSLGLSAIDAIAPIKATVKPQSDRSLLDTNGEGQSKDDQSWT